MARVYVPPGILSSFPNSPPVPNYTPGVSYPKNIPTWSGVHVPLLNTTPLTQPVSVHSLLVGVKGLHGATSSVYTAS